MARTLSVLIVAVAALLWQAPASAQTLTTAAASPRLAATVVNPCTNQYVSISGATALSVSDAVDVDGQLTFAVSAATSATAAAFATSTSGTANKYAFREIENVIAHTARAQALEVTFESKLLTSGLTAGDRWRLTVQIRVAVDQFGKITAASVTPGLARCIG